MIYTLGNTDIYLKRHREGVKTNTPMVKIGRHADYVGGSVWKTQEEVQAWIDTHQPRLKGYAVFGVIADWNLETAPPAKLQMPWRDLLVDSEIVLLDNVDYEKTVKGSVNG
ncbi:hypothetical protein KAR91_88435 [Candidatus Pacearchaeota archaeon]|nr:hypothetical protein [Candidatus Pacearchaeota archaeon]